MEDNKLIELAQSGNLKAQEDVINKYKQLVSFVTRRFFLVGGDSDDLTQEGMIGLLKAINTFDFSKNASFYNFAKTVIERQVYNAIKSDRTQKNIALNDSVTLNNLGFVNNDESEVGYAAQSLDPSPEALILSLEGAKGMVQEIKRVLSDYELKVLKFYLEGFNYNDIATQIEASPKSVDNALNRIKTKLQFLKERI